MADTSTRATQAALLLNQYIPGVQEAMRNEVIGLRIAQRSKKDKWQGAKLVFDVKESHGGGVGARQEGQGLQLPGEPKHFNPEVLCKYAYASFRLTWQLLETAKEDEAAFKNALADAWESKVIRLKKYENAAFYGTGNGVLATVVTGGTLEKEVNKELQIEVDTTRYLMEGDIIALWTTGALNSTVLANGGQTNETGTDDCESVYVKSIDSETLVTIARSRAAANDATVATANAIRLYGDKLAAVTTHTNVPTGLRAFADDGQLVPTLQAISRTTHPKWKGNVLTVADGTALSRQHPVLVAHASYRRSGIYPDTAICDATQIRAYIEIAEPDIRHKPVDDFDVGYSAKQGITIGPAGKIPFTVDFDCPYDSLFMFPKSKLRIAQLADLHIDDNGGGPLKPNPTPFGAASTGDVFHGWFRHAFEWYTMAPFAFSVIENLNYSLEI
jgi:hypothetical protein